MSGEIILYDLPSKEGWCWSLNAWKIRLVLNFKGIPYKTEWIEYPDLKPTFEKFGIPPNSSGLYAYTSPTILLPSGEYIMESLSIAHTLERLHPSPSLHLSSPYESRMEKFLPELVGKIRPVFVPLVPKLFLNPRSAEYFIGSREKALGLTLGEYAEKAEKGWEDVKPYVKELGEWYVETEGPFLLGKEVSFADFTVLGWLKMLDRLGVVGRLWEIEGGGQLKEVYDAGKEWLERDTY